MVGKRESIIVVYPNAIKYKHSSAGTVVPFGVGGILAVYCNYTTHVIIVFEHRPHPVITYPRRRAHGRHGKAQACGLGAW